MSCSAGVLERLERYEVRGAETLVPDRCNIHQNATAHDTRMCSSPDDDGGKGVHEQLLVFPQPALTSGVLEALPESRRQAVPTEELVKMFVCVA